MLEYKISIMKTINFKNNWLTTTGLLLALPAAYFILVAILKYWLKINEPFDTIQPVLERWGIKESLGWNINLLILFGPVLALLLTFFQVVQLEWRFNKEEFLLNFTIKKRWFPLLITVLSAGLLAILFFYLVGENCNC